MLRKHTCLTCVVHDLRPQVLEIAQVLEWQVDSYRSAVLQFPNAIVHDEPVAVRFLNQPKLRYSAEFSTVPVHARTNAAGSSNTRPFGVKAVVNVGEA